MVELPMLCLRPFSTATVAGVGLALPTLTAAGATALPIERFATGTGILTMARQIGAVLGVAILVLVLGSPRTPFAAQNVFHHGWYEMAAAELVTAVAYLAMPRPRGTQVAAATKALQAVALGLLEEHLRHCITQAIAEGRDDTAEKVREALDAITRLVRS